MLALEARFEFVARLDHVSAQTRRLLLREHLYIVDRAVFEETDHKIYLVGITGLNEAVSLDGIADRRVVRAHDARGDDLRTLDSDSIVNILRLALECRQNLGQRLQLVFGIGLGNRIFCDVVDHADQKGRDGGNGKQHHDHISKCTFHTQSSYLTCFTPKRTGRQYLLIRGTVAFIMNMANDMPSGYAPHRRIIIVRAPTPTP